MITHLEGVLSAVSGGSVVVDVGGVGYLVRVGPETRAELDRRRGERVRILTHLAVRENALDLYGFLDREERDFFELLIGISGIGPKSALAILDVADVATLTSAITSGESGYLTKVSGIGKKNAQKIILELQNKLGNTSDEMERAAMRDELDTLEALKALGYRAREARAALAEVPKDVTNTNERLRSALKHLGT